MSAILQQSISSFFKLSHNDRLGSSNSMTEGNIAMFYFLHIFYSKRICKLVLILLISLLLTWTSTWLTNTCSIAKFFAPGFITTTCQNSMVKDSLKESIDWSRFACIQYATNLPYFCNLVMVFEILY